MARKTWFAGREEMFNNWRPFMLGLNLKKLFFGTNKGRKPRRNSNLSIEVLEARDCPAHMFLVNSLNPAGQGSFARRFLMPI